MPALITETAQEYILGRVLFEPSTGCWLWPGALNNKGYGVCRHPEEKRNNLVHRMSFRAFKGEFPEGKPAADHLCRVPCCCNPDHLEAVTLSENTRRWWQHRKATRGQ